MVISGHFSARPGNWNAAAARQVHSPGRQSRFTSPWDVTCTGRFSIGNNVNCLLGGAAQASAGAAQVRTDHCASWSGPFVAATACKPASLRQALRDGTLAQSGATDLELNGAVEANAPGLTQAIADPLAPGQTLTLTGAQTDTELRVRAGDADEVVDAVYQNLPSTGPVQVTAGTRRGRPTLDARAADGDRLPASRTRRATARPPARPRALIARRRGAHVRVSFRARAPRAAIELHGRRGRLLSSRLVRVRNARSRQTATLTRGRRGRSVKVVALSATGRPSRPATARIR